jgi:hypothetical protein
MACLCQEEIESLRDELNSLRWLLQLWEQRVVCLQCGNRYSDRACGPTHAIIHAEVCPNA